MEQRIFGVETEYGLTAAHPGLDEPVDLQVEQIAELLFAPILRQYRSTNVFLPNGGRIYLDVGSHPEYATAECISVWDLLAQIRAGQEMLSDLAASASEELSQQGTPTTVHLFANNFDSVGNSYGCHENYLLKRGRDFRRTADALITFFVTRQIMVGAGDIKEDENGQPQYVFAARSDQMHDALSSATTRSRPIINTRDEPLADTSSYRRLHVIVGDTNVAEPTTALKVAATDIVLAALENGVRLDDLALADPMGAIRAINFDLQGTTQVSLADGRKMTAVEIQEEIFQRVMAATPQDSLSELYRYLVGLWQRTLQAVRGGNWSDIDTEIDFAIKKKLLDAYVTKTNVSLADSRVARLALSYHDITPAGLAPKLEETGLMVRLTSENQVQHACNHPPSTTRAALRGEVIKAAQEAGRELGADWVNLRLEGQGLTVTLQDPFATEDDQVEKMLSILAREGGTL